nr:amidohydrolase [Sporohalobacter salinus]
MTDNTYKLNLEGKTVVPGFIDSHVHFVQTGLNKLFLNFTGVNSQEEMLDLIRNKAEKLVDGEWIYGVGFDENNFANLQLPTRWQLDKIASDNPVWLSRIDCHSCVLNSKALKLLNISQSILGLDKDRSGRLTGIIRNKANFKVRNWILDNIHYKKRVKALQIATKLALEAGITTIHSMEGGGLFSELDLKLLLEVKEKNPLDIVVFNQTMDVERVLNLGLNRIGGCIALDGSIGSRTAALKEPYADDPTQDFQLYHFQRRINKFVTKAHKEGLQIAVHAIGGQAINQILKAYEVAQKKYPRDNPKHRIEHGELIDQQQINKARELGVTLSIQPAFDYYWGGSDGMYGTRLGARRAKRTNPYRNIIDAGCLIIGGSDSDVTPMNPLLGIHGAVNHSNPEQQLTIKEALKLFTINAARATSEEDIKGSIEVGKVANFTILNQDLLAVSKEKIKDIKVIKTIINGKIHYSRC